MRFAVLNHAEAADAAVMANLAKYLMVHTIAVEDRPDTGAPDPAQLPLALAPQVVLPLSPQAAFAPSSAAAAAPVIAPVANIPAPPVTAASAPALPPVPPAAAPSTPAVPPSPASGVVLDSRGYPWDERIHTGTKTTNKDGSWRQKRETDPALVAAVEAEHRPAAAVPPAPPAPPAPPPVNSVFAMGAAAAAAADDTPPTFGEFMLRLTPHMTAGKFSNDQLGEVIRAQGMTGLPDLMLKPANIPAVWASVKALLGL